MSEYNRDDQPFQAAPRRPYRSFFWPIILIGVGVIVLLINLELVPRINLWSLWRLWPVLLILAGLDIVFGHRWPALGALLGLAVVGLVIVLLILAPTLGWASGEGLEIGGVRIFTSGQEVKSDSFSEPIGNAESATVVIDLSNFDATIATLAGSRNLIEARVDYLGDMRFDVTGNREKRVVLDEGRQGAQIFMPIGDRDAYSYSWDIALTPDLPMDLTIDASSGSCDMDLSELDLKRLDLDGSSGHLTVALPDTRHSIRFGASSGDATFDIPEGADVTFELDMSSGRVVLNVAEDVDLDLDLTDASSGDLVVSVPRGAAVQVAVTDSSSGRVRLPSDLSKVREGDERDEGVWEAKGYDSADHRIVIKIGEMSSGDVIVTYG